jgi:hypothetical protein
MKNTQQRRESHKTRRRSARAALGFAAMLVFTIVFFSFQSARAQTYTILYSFGDFAGGGDHPYVGLTQDSAGNLYGTAGGGDYHAAGTVFKLDTIGN